MRVIFVVCLTLAIGYSELDLAFKEQKEKELHDLINECSKKEMTDKEDLEEIFIEKPLTRKGAKCLFACIQQMEGVQDKTGKLSLEGALRSVEAFKIDGDIHKKLEQVYTTCIERVGDAGDRCETAGKFFDCSLIVYQEVGLPYNFLDI